MGNGTRQWEGDTRKCERDEVHNKGKGGEKDDLGGWRRGYYGGRGSAKRRRGEGLQRERRERRAYKGDGGR